MTFIHSMTRQLAAIVNVMWTRHFAVDLLSMQPFVRMSVYVWGKESKCFVCVLRL